MSAAPRSGTDSFGSSTPEPDMVPLMDLTQDQENVRPVSYVMSPRKRARLAAGDAPATSTPPAPPRPPASSGCRSAGRIPSVSYAGEAPTPMRARWSQKSEAELRERLAKLTKLRHTSMLQRAALACGDDAVDDSPEYLKLQEQSCTARIREIEEELRSRSLPVASGSDDSFPTSSPPPSSGGSAGSVGARGGRTVLGDISNQSEEDAGSAAPAHKTAAPAKGPSPAPTPAPARSVPVPHPWDAQVNDALHRLFKLPSFRPDQREAIDATLAGRDVFCLMPTGGGKSLCYQLPATVTRGHTDGVTVVISPLIALIHNQVKNLLRLEIPTLAITSDLSDEDRRFACSELFKRDMQVRLLYLTPEFICNARLAANLFQHLHTTRRLARFVIDEAHCVDQWGHDFRPDYVRLSMLRQEYPGVPIMALTATARIDTVQDIQTQLGMRNALVLRQSFNRPNLTYSVRPKRRGAATLADIAAFIREHHAHECGIIYCLSRRDCENVAADLGTQFGIRARHFHAGLDNQDKMRIQDGWERDEFKIIVATIAFGMGIDKADVRFVIHHSVPKSLEGYYQETGRAGRDGKLSECILYWSIDDSRKLENIIRSSEDASPEQKQHQLTCLAQVRAFCQSLTECRRTNILKYFGETFDPAHCHASCDNCRREPVHLVDMTRAASDFVSMVKLIGNARPPTHTTRSHYQSVFRGSRRKEVVDRGHHRNIYHGRGAQMGEAELKRLVDHLLSENILEEYAQKAPYQRFPNHYVRLGPQASALLSGDLPVQLDMPRASGEVPRRADVPRRAAPRTSTPPPAEPDDFDLSPMPLSPEKETMLAAAEQAAAARRPPAPRPAVPPMAVRTEAPAARGPAAGAASAARQGSATPPAAVANPLRLAPSGQRPGGRFRVAPMPLIGRPP